MNNALRAMILSLAMATPLAAAPAQAFDLRAAMPEEDSIPQSNEWRGLGQDKDVNVTTIYSANAVSLFSDAIRSVTNLFSGDETRATMKVTAPTGLLTDLHGTNTAAVPTSSFALNYEAPARDLGALGDLAATMWVGQEDRTLDPEADADLDVNKPWQFGIKVNMPF